MSNYEQNETTKWKNLVKESTASVKNADIKLEQDLEAIQAAIDHNFNLNDFRHTALRQKSNLESEFEVNMRYLN